MSVYTSVSRAALESLLKNYRLGELVNFEGISAGIENTNYFVTTNQGRFVLTLFEVLRAEELPYYLQLMAFLNEHGIPCAHPVADNDSNYVHELNNKPATLMQRLQGRSNLQPDEHHCREIGLVLARMHIAGKAFPLQQENPRGERWRLATGEQLLPMLDERDANILQQELRDQSLHQHHDLPKGAIHADLFRDNVLFLGDEVSGIVDFYNACDDNLLYDVAITVNDWCVDENGSLVYGRVSALCTAYHSLRPVSETEMRAWPTMLRSAALRFWLSRLWDKHYPKPGELTFQKDPDEFKNILLMRRRESEYIADIWKSC